MSQLLSGLWGGGGSSTPKRSSSVFKPTPLTPKLTTATSPDYPPPSGGGRNNNNNNNNDNNIHSRSNGSLDNSNSNSHDAQWEHVNRNGSPPSPPTSPDVFDDEAERLGYSQVQAVARSPPTTGSGGSGSPSPRQWQEELEQLRRERDEAVAAQRKSEGERDKWERKVMDLRTSIRADRERERDGVLSSASASGAKGRRERERDKERDPGVMAATADALKEENEKLKSMVLEKTQQLDAAREERVQERSQLQSELERLAGELDDTRGTRKAEVETLRVSMQEHAQRIEHLTIDRERVRKDRDSFKIEADRLKRQHAKESEETKTAIEELHRDRVEVESELRSAKKSLDTFAANLDNSIHEINVLKRELSYTRDLQRKAAEYKQRLEVQYKELQSAREESSALKKEFTQLATLLEDRTSELKGAQSFLTTADAFSGAEVTSTLQRLNAEVLQSTAFMAESMVEMFFVKTTPLTPNADEQQAACKRVSTAIGGVIVRSLGAKKHTEDPILIQIAFQAYLTYHLYWIACAWIIGGEDHHNRFINAIYQNVREKEAQAVAGRWRAFTHAHVPSTPLDDSQLPYQIASKMISGLGDILLAAGCGAPKSDVDSALSSKFAEKLAFLVSMALRVNKIVGQDVTSCDFEVVAIPPGVTFDTTAMEDSYDDGKGTNDTSKVLCATDLGLKKRTRVAMTGDKQWEVKDLLRPKVALESVIEILDE